MEAESDFFCSRAFFATEIALPFPGKGALSRIDAFARARTGWREKPRIYSRHFLPREKTVAQCVMRRTKLLINVLVTVASFLRAP